MNLPPERRFANLPRNLVVASLVAILAAGVWASARLARERALGAISAGAEQQMRLFVSSLRSEVERYEFLPQVLARDEKIMRLLDAPRDPRRVDEVNRFLESVNASIGASDTYVMDRRGLTLAASNWNRERPFVGQNFAFRPYFKSAIAGEPGRYFALGTTSRRRGYYFAHPVARDGEVLGVAVVKVSFERVEAAWRRAPEVILVTDRDGVVFITNRPHLRYRTRGPLSGETLARIEASRQYPGVRIEPLPIADEEPFDAAARLVTFTAAIDEPGPGAGRRGEPVAYLANTAQLPAQGWIVHVLSSTAPVGRQVAGTVAVAVLLATVAVLALFYVGQRRRNLRERMAHQRDVEDTLRRARGELEQRVRQRTAELESTNRRLDLRIAEHERAEAELRRTQEELIQAAKLAALGQLSAGITHELNQPLAAIRSFADNARVLLERDRGEEAARNLETISELTERMARITAQLKSFARKSETHMDAVAVGRSIEEVLALVAARVRADDIETHTRLPEPEVHVRADALRLEQVLLNLVKNAIDALEGCAQRRVEIAVRERGAEVEVEVADSGPGIEPGALERIFDPFFTTKPAGVGLGLGLSISYSIVRDFGGELSAANRDRGGAAFTLRLPRAEPSSGEAAA